MNFQTSKNVKRNRIQTKRFRKIKNGRNMKTWTECGRLTLFFSVFGCSEQNGRRVKAEIEEWVCCFEDKMVLLWGHVGDLETMI